MFDKLVDVFITLWDHLKPIIFIMEYEQAVVFRGGSFIKIWDPGWHIRIPFVDDYHTENVKADTFEIKDVNITTLDGKTISVGGEFDFYIEDIEKSTVETNDWRSNLQDVCKGILSSELEDRNWEDIKKKSTKTAISKKIFEKATTMGVIGSNFNFTDKCESTIHKVFHTLPTTFNVNRN